jgi:hypothetical protein
MILILRISCQLNEDENITRENVVDRMSSIGLRLEHIIATLSKKKQNFYSNLESINTDCTIQVPPDFMGIKQFIVEIPQKDRDEEDSESEENERNPTFKSKKGSKKIDEEVEFLEDNYSKVKRGVKLPNRRNSAWEKINQFDQNNSSKNKLNKTVSLQLFNRSKKDPALKPISQLIHRTKRIFLE